ncbi:MAG: HAD family phosphatase [Coriobacteriia bacterium]|nr:HAD family phosphatase [Coriobacteriia bacterium]MCL2606717.1 HAD family phosphatase [Coriobacteriia bacterium]
MNSLASIEFKAVIFDMDGVIFNTEVIARRAWRTVFEKYGFEFTDKTYKKVIGRTMEAAFQILIDEYGPELPMDEMSVKQDVLWQEATQGSIEQKPCVAEILNYLQQQGIPCAVGSSTYHDEVEERLRVNGLRDYFKAVVGGDYVPNAKPAPDIFLKCAEYLKMRPNQCLVIEDSVNGIRAANAAGMQTMMIPDLIPAGEVDNDLDFTVCASLCELKELFVAADKKRSDTEKGHLFGASVGMVVSDLLNAAGDAV